jgi:hypothetical protein
MLYRRSRLASTSPTSCEIRRVDVYRVSTSAGRCARTLRPETN